VVENQFLQRNCRCNILGLGSVALYAAPPKIGVHRSSNYIDIETFEF